MANNYTSSVFRFDAGSTEQAETLVGWLEGDVPADLKELLIAANPDCCDTDGVKYTIVDNAEAEIGTSIYVDASEGDLELLEIVLSYAMETWSNVPSPQGFEWANWCSSPRVGEFGGGALVLRRGAAPKWMNTGQWLSCEMEILDNVAVSA